LADGLGFKGGATEKVLYADVMMLSWDAQQEETLPMLAPSIWFGGRRDVSARQLLCAQWHP
jgi:hypothetical protein